MSQTLAISSCQNSKVDQIMKNRTKAFRHGFLRYAAFHTLVKTVLSHESKILASTHVWGHRHDAVASKLSR